MSPGPQLKNALRAARACSLRLSCLTTSLTVYSRGDDVESAHHKVSGHVLALVDAVLALNLATEDLSVLAALQQANHDTPKLMGSRQERSHTECLFDTAIRVVMGVVIAIDPERLRDDTLSPTITREFLEKRLAQVQAIEHVGDAIDMALEDVDLRRLQDEIEAEFHRAAGSEAMTDTQPGAPAYRPGDDVDRSSEVTVGTSSRGGESQVDRDVS